MVENMPEGQLRHTLSDVRRTGIAMIRRSYPSKTVSVDSPVFDAQGSVVAAVLAPAVPATARAVSRNVGHHAEVSPDVRTHSEG